MRGKTNLKRWWGRCVVVVMVVVVVVAVTVAVTVAVVAVAAQEVLKE